MSLKKNIQGQFDTRFEDGNRGGILKMSPINSIYPNGGKSFITYTERVSKNNVIIGINNKYLSYTGGTTDIKYNNLIQPYDFVRIYTSINRNDWVDIKVTSVKLDVLGSYETIINGIVVRGDFDSVTLNDDVTWTFYHQVEKSKGAPKNIEIVNVINNEAEVRWEDSTINASSLFYQLGYRKWGENEWAYTEVGGWINQVNIELEAARWPPPITSFNSEPSYWMEVSEPEAADGIKAGGWVSINLDGNFKNFYVIERGSGYLRTPNIKLYYKVLDDHRINNIAYSRTSTDPEINIIIAGHTFDNNDKVIIDSGILQGEHIVFDVSPSGFKISPANISEIPANGFVYRSSMNLELAPVPIPETPGRIIPELFRDKYIIQGLDSNSIYEVFILSYFDKDLRNFSDMSTPLKFITR